MQDSLARPRILLAMLEFPRWEQARAWGYTGTFAIEEGLRAAGAECVVLPAIHGVATGSRTSWLYHARKLLAGERFDQVWLWLVHNEYDEAFLHWISELAPVIVGWVGESLEHSAEELARFPQFARREAIVERQLTHITHALAVDERDAAHINERGLADAIWLPMAVPARCIEPAAAKPNYSKAAFFGSAYGERAEWLANPLFQDIIARPQPPEGRTCCPALFDRTHQAAFEHLAAGHIVDRALLTQYVEAWRAVRRQMFDIWIEELKQWPCTVNLPSLGKVYTSRVVETMAAGRPVISWKIPDRPRNLGLFASDEEILLFDRDRPDQLAAQIGRVHKEPAFAAQVAARARAVVARAHTVEQRMQQVLSWIATGEAPDYGVSTMTATPDTRVAAFETALSQAAMQSNAATVDTQRLTDRQSMMRYLEQGRRALQSEEYGRAVAVWREAVRSHPEVVGFHAALAKALVAAGETQAALAAYRTGVFDHPSSLELLLPALTLALEQRSVDDALLFLRHAWRATPTETALAQLSSCTEQLSALIREAHDRAQGIEQHRLETNDRHGIKRSYVFRTEVCHHDDRGFTDEWQDEVYALTRSLMEEHALRSILDVGCGSGFKLIKHFSEFETIGAELSPAFEYLQETYPDRRWIRSDLQKPPSDPVDVVLVSDVIEHLIEPDELLSYLQATRCQFVVISTPDRNRLKRGHDGPPFNPHHVREWAYAEFADYVGRHLPVLRHGISNQSQATQYVVCQGVGLTHSARAT